MPPPFRPKDLLVAPGDFGIDRNAPWRTDDWGEPGTAGWHEQRRRTALAYAQHLACCAVTQSRADTAAADDGLDYQEIANLVGETGSNGPDNVKRKHDGRQPFTAFDLVVWPLALGLHLLPGVREGLAGDLVVVQNEQMLLPPRLRGHHFR